MLKRVQERAREPRDTEGATEKRKEKGRVQRKRKLEESEKR